MSDILFSILTPGIPSRMETLTGLLHKLMDQAAHVPNVELLCFVDSKRRSIGQKRGDLVQLAQGWYVAFVDDDDDVPDYYVDAALEAIAANPSTDVFTFDQRCWYEGLGPFLVSFGLTHPDEEMHLVPEGGNYADIRRAASHTCIWRAELAKSVPFEDASYFEDTRWAEALRAKAETEVHIPRVMHYYKYDSLVSEAHEWGG